MSLGADQLSILDFSVSYPALTIRADFAVGPLERLIMSGPSGSGKSTICRFLGGFNLGADFQGRLILDQQDLTAVPPHLRNFGIVPQHPVIFPHLSVIENAGFGLRMRGVESKARRAILLPWLERCGLSHLIDSRADVLSGGEKQRLALIRAWSWKPRVIVLDEPFSALDLVLRQKMADWVTELHQAHPIPMVLITHDSAEASRVGTRELRVQKKSETHLWVDESRR